MDGLPTNVPGWEHASLDQGSNTLANLSPFDCAEKLITKLNRVNWTAEKHCRGQLLNAEIFAGG